MVRAGGLSARDGGGEREPRDIGAVSERVTRGCEPRDGGGGQPGARAEVERGRVEDAERVLVRAARRVDGVLDRAMVREVVKRGVGAEVMQRHRDFGERFEGTENVGCVRVMRGDDGDAKRRGFEIGARDVAEWGGLVEEGFVRVAEKED